MFNSSAMVLVPVLLLAAFPAVGVAQDATATLESLRKSMGGNPPAALRISAAGSGYEAGPGESARKHVRIEPHTRDLDPAADEAVLWTTPHGFLVGATSRKATAATETLLGTKYTVLAFASPGGRQVRGYVNEQNVLERTRTEIVDPARGRVRVETVFLQWGDFNGVRFPTVWIQKENDQVTRILIVDKVEPIGS